MCSYFLLGILNHWLKLVIFRQIINFIRIFLLSILRTNSWLTPGASSGPSTKKGTWVEGR